MKHKTQQRKEEEKDQKIDEYKEYYAEFLQRKEAGNQTIAALSEIEIILMRMAELKDQGMENSPEYKRLEQRLNMLKDFKDRQRMLFDGIGL